MKVTATIDTKQLDIHRYNLITRALLKIQKEIGQPIDINKIEFTEESDILKIEYNN